MFYFEVIRDTIAIVRYHNNNLIATILQIYPDQTFLFMLETMFKRILDQFINDQGASGGLPGRRCEPIGVDAGGSAMRRTGRI